MHILRPSDDLEKMRQRLAEMVGRPAFIASREQWQGPDSRYKLPGAKRYTHIGSLALYTSPYSDGDRCVKVDEGPPRIRYFDMALARWVYLIYPLLPDDYPPVPRGERPPSYIDTVAAPLFRQLGLGYDLGFNTSWLSANDQTIAPELEPYVHTYRRMSGGHKAQGVRFASSTLIEAPQITSMDWHHGTTFGSRGYIGQTMQAPGQYNMIDGAPRGLVEVLGVNRTCLVDADPGRCVICHGDSGERAHFAVVASGQHAYPDGWVCRTCFPATAQRWVEMLQTWKAPERPPEAEKKS